jgi:RsiW-degrading membrane proteinase PrsW (M82 family)
MLHFIYVRDKYDREPLHRVLLVFFVSMLTVIPAAVYEHLFVLNDGANLWELALHVFLVVALAEEIIKYVALRYLAMPHHSFNEVYDGILYGVAASLGFATSENLMYVFGSGEGAWSTAILRAILSVPGHALWGAIMGYFAGRAWFTSARPAKLRLVWTGLALAILLHGAYDFFAFGAAGLPDALAGLFVLGVPATVIVSWIIALLLVRRAQHESVFKRPSPMVNPVAAVLHSIKYCHQCGHKELAASAFCTRCGYRFP